MRIRCGLIYFVIGTVFAPAGCGGCDEGRAGTSDTWIVYDSGNAASDTVTLDSGGGEVASDSGDGGDLPVEPDADGRTDTEEFDGVDGRDASCRALGATCTSNSVCCTDAGLCSEGTCGTCRKEGESCRDDVNCCSDLVCVREGTCEDLSCKNLYESCSSDEECCSGVCECPNCDGGTCDPCRCG